MDDLLIRCLAENLGTKINTVRVVAINPSARTVLPEVKIGASMKGHIHNYIDGICVGCLAKDPNYVPICIGTKNISLQESKMLFNLAGHDLGEYTFTKSGDNWIIQNENGNYIGFDKNTLSNNAFGWTYKNGHFETSVTTSSGSNSILSWLFGGNKKTTTTYYLAYSNGEIVIETNSNSSSVSFKKHVESNVHSFGPWTTKNSTHSHIYLICNKTESEKCLYGDDHKCLICGAFDSAFARIDISVKKSSKTSGSNNILSWILGNQRTTTYTTAITVTANGTIVKAIEYYTDNGTSWNSGATISSKKEIDSFLIRVTDGNDTMHYYMYDGTNVITK